MKKYIKLRQFLKVLQKNKQQIRQFYIITSHSIRHKKMRNRFTSIEASRQSIENKLSHLEAKIKKRQNQPFCQTMPLQDINMITNPRQNLNYVNASNINPRNQKQKLNKSISQRLTDIKQRTLSSNANVNLYVNNFVKNQQKSPLKKSKQMKNSLLMNNKVKQNFIQNNQKIKRQNLRQSSAINHRNNNPDLTFNNSSNNANNSINNNNNKNSYSNNINNINYPSNLNQTELYDMIKTIMLGQQQIQKELSQIKQDLSVQPSVRKSYTAQRQERQSLGIYQNLNNHQNNQKLFDTMNLKQNFDKNPDNQLNIKSKTVNLNNLEENNKAQIDAQEIQNISDRSNVVELKQKPLRQKKKKISQQNFQKLVYQARHRKPQRFKINEQSQILTGLWQDISKKIKSLNLQYKQTSHLNNRHINDHLMNTIQLQRKTKENLVNKVYSQCNNCIYK